MNIRQLDTVDASAFQALRLAGLLECPTAFASSHAEEADLAVETVAARLAPSGVFGVYGAFDAAAGLVAVAGLGREQMQQLAHKAMLWGMYVAPGFRRSGLGRRLVSHLLASAAAEPGLRQVMLGVNAGNVAARAMYESLGFVAWGTEPGSLRVAGEAHDEVWMSMALPGRDASRPRPAPAVLIHSGDPSASRAWYQRLLDARALHLGEPWNVDMLERSGIQLEFVPADAKVASGAAGSVLYWPMDDFDAARRHAETLGAKLYRGPLDIEDGARMAQFKDPWGNLFGLRGR